MAGDSELTDLTRRLCCLRGISHPDGIRSGGRACRLDQGHRLQHRHLPRSFPAEALQRGIAPPGRDHRRTAGSSRSSRKPPPPVVHFVGHPTSTYARPLTGPRPHPSITATAWPSSHSCSSSAGRGPTGSTVRSVRGFSPNARVGLHPRRQRRLTLQSVSAGQPPLRTTSRV